MVNPDDNEIIAHELTDDDTSDAAMIGGLVANTGGNIRKIIADGAYDGEPNYQAIQAVRPARSPPSKPSIPDKRGSLTAAARGMPCRRDSAPWPDGLATATWIRQTLSRRNRHLPHQRHQRRTPYAPNFRRSAKRSRHSHQDRQPQHLGRKTNDRARPLNWLHSQGFIR